MKLERTCKCIKDYLVKSEPVYSNDWQDKDKVIFKHGLFEYKSDKTIDEYLSYLQSQKEPVIVRILLEEFRDNGHEEQFKKLCSRLESTYSKIKFCGGTYKRGKKVYSFKS